MTTANLKTFTGILEARARDLRSSLAERGCISVERVADAFDEHLLSAGRESAARSLALEFRLLRQVDAARARLRDGTFGLCLRCGERIPLKRLEAIPWAMYCVSCQAEIEAIDTVALLPGRAAA